MEEDVLSDVVPSNIVSRQVRTCRDEQLGGFTILTNCMKESEGGESEYDEPVDEMEVDELQSDGEKVRVYLMRSLFHPSCRFSSIQARLPLFFLSYAWLRLPREEGRVKWAKDDTGGRASPTDTTIHSTERPPLTIKIGQDASIGGEAEEEAKAER